MDPGFRRERVGNSGRMRSAHAAGITCTWWRFWGWWLLNRHPGAGRDPGSL